jgi:hypothetical protein
VCGPLTTNAILHRLKSRTFSHLPANASGSGRPNLLVCLSGLRQHGGVDSSVAGLDDRGVADIR